MNPDGYDPSVFVASLPDFSLTKVPSVTSTTTTFVSFSRIDRQTFGLQSLIIQTNHVSSRKLSTMNIIVLMWWSIRELCCTSSYVCLMIYVNWIYLFYVNKPNAKMIYNMLKCCSLLPLKENVGRSNFRI